MEEEKKLDSWDAFTGNYLRVEDVKSKEDVYVCVNVLTDEFDGKDKVKFVLERNEIAKEFTLNATNIQAVRDLGYEKPKDVIGCKIQFDKIKQYNPTTKKQQDSLLIVVAEKVE